MKKQNLFLGFGIAGILVLIFLFNNIFSTLYSYSVAVKNVSITDVINTLKNTRNIELKKEFISIILPILFTITNFILFRYFYDNETSETSNTIDLPQHLASPIYFAPKEEKFEQPISYVPSKFVKFNTPKDSTFEYKSNSLYVKINYSEIPTTIISSLCLNTQLKICAQEKRVLYIINDEELGTMNDYIAQDMIRFFGSDFCLDGVLQDIKEENNVYTFTILYHFPKFTTITQSEQIENIDNGN